MLDTSKTVKISWQNKNRKYYEDKGYIFTNYGDEFDCATEDVNKKSDKLIPVICDYCGRHFYKKARNHKHEYDYCNGSCSTYGGYITNYEKRKDLAFDKLENFCNKKGYTLITSKDEYTGSFMKVKYICPVHGEQSGTIDNMTHGHGCIKCQYKDIRESRLKYTKDEAEQIINSKYGNVLLNPHEYVNMSERNLRIKCGCCGKQIFTTTLYDYITGSDRCIFCSQSLSRNEFIIANYLDSNNIEYKSEKTFKDCRDKTPLPFDFYLPTYNLCIEYDGEYHYRPIRISKEETEEDIQNRFELRQFHDQIKNEYCQSHGIELLRIPYWEQGNIEQIITDKLNELDRRYSLVS